MGVLKAKDMGAELWRSKSDDNYKQSRPYIITFGVSLGVISIAFSLILRFYMLSFFFLKSTYSIEEVLVLLILFLAIDVFELFMGSIITVLFLLVLKYRIALIIVYEKGIKVRNPYWLLQRRFVPFTAMKNIREEEDFTNLIIFVKDQKPAKVLGRFIPELKYLMVLIKKHVVLIKNRVDVTIIPPCMVCNSNVGSIFCSDCGLQICTRCKEEGHFCDCRINRLNLKTTFFFLLSCAPLLFLLIALSDKNITLFNIGVISPDEYGFYFQVFPVWYFLFFMLTSFSTVPYGMASLISILLQMKKSKGELNEKGKAILTINLFLAGCLIIFKGIYFIQFLFSGQIVSIVLPIVEISFIAILSGVIFHYVHKKNLKHIAF